jgi:tetratricopeptide (TPR) repeat protein
MVSSKEVILIILLFLLALSVRLIYLSELQVTPWFDTPMRDAGLIDQRALAISKGQLSDGESYFRAPLYSHFLAGIYALFGHNYRVALAIQFLLGSFSVVLIYLLGRMVFRPAVGLIAALLAAFYGTLIYFEGEFLVPVLFLFLNLLFMLMMLSAARSPRWWKWAGCGLLLGLSAITRPNVLVFVLVMVPWMMVWLAKRCGLSFKRSLLSVAWVLLGIVVVISPVTVRNYIVGNDVVPIASQGGVNFYIGNNQYADGYTPIVPGTRTSGTGIYYDAVKRAEEAMGRPLKASEVSNYWFRQGLQFITSMPKEALHLTLKKLALFWEGMEIANNKDLYFFAKWTPLLNGLLWRRQLFCPFGIVAPLALVGMVLAWRRKESNSLILALFVFSYMVGVVLFFVNARYRLPVVPFLLPFAAYCMYSLFQERSLPWMVISVILIFGFGLMVNLNLSGYELTPLAESHNSLGSVYLGKKMYPEAVEQFQKAVSLESYYVFPVAGLAKAYSEMGETERAIEYYERAIALKPEMMELHFHAGFSYYTAGRLDEAIAAWQEAARLQPEFAQPHFQLGIAYEDWGDVESAIEAYRRALQINPLYVLANYNLGHLYKRLGRIEEAVAEFEQAIETNPQYGDAYNSLAWLYAQEEMRLDEGIELAKKALELDPESAAYWDTLAELYIKKDQLDRAGEIFRRMLREHKEPGEDFWRGRLEEIREHENGR